VDGRQRLVLQRDRRRDPYPWTWEIPLASAVVVLVLVAYALQLGRSLANLLVGAGWAWPDRAGVWGSLPAVVGGDAGAGLDALQAPPAGPALVSVCVAVSELAVLAVLACSVKVVLDRWGPARVRGMASRTEAELLLGVSRLRRVRGVVRPDLYGRAE
jgi:hypothetical protein